jgi:hypothetical protein
VEPWPNAKCGADVWISVGHMFAEILALGSSCI